MATGGAEDDDSPSRDAPTRQQRRIVEPTTDSGARAQCSPEAVVSAPIRGHGRRGWRTSRRRPPTSCPLTPSVTANNFAMSAPYNLLQRRLLVMCAL